MNMNFKSWLVGTTMLVMTTTGAFAEVVLNRGNSMDPESLDPHKTSTVNEAHVLRDLFMGLTMQDAKAAFSCKSSGQCSLRYGVHRSREQWNI